MPNKKSALDLVHITPGRVAELKQEINTLERMLKADKVSKHPKIQDEVEFVGNIKKKKEELRIHAPVKLTGQNANKAYALAKKLRGILEKHMPTSKAYFQDQTRDKDSHDKKRNFENAVLQQIAFQTNPKLQMVAQRYKHLMRRIDPDDPNISNLETIRR